ncbi:helix-turn-helix domain-containing protein [Lactiplantibacillus plantarum]|nr:MULTISPECIES: helix-turn-helix domain-containing protein [Lactiplantibacillus]MCM8651224.1 helix-turn-helix domain-containing protein [Lactiplantibacillus sp. E932]MBP5840834.1 helix-turn-helix domain-containing protein [Lactiplantibacillus plantarum]MDN7072215.1 helix-turn-helix domain-containing protein [Lactiplantibacillus plantarum]MDO7548566.1 helix-turn-helix domain-containing protein [Lactiplantibacillus plantarum]MDO7806412.1 helix-turn-helix domain-containing protein [Lactiplantiba
MDQQLDALLHKLTSIEAIQVQTHQFVQDLPADTIDERNDEFISLNNRHFFKNKDIYVSKHNRYAAYPEHTHQFLELNYMYAGHCVQYIDGQKVELQAGDVVLLNVGSSHSLEALGDDDILINILFRNKSIHLDLLDKLYDSDSILFNFLMNTTTKSQTEPAYILFRKRGNSDVIRIIDTILSEYYFSRNFSNQIISSYLPILLISLVRDYQSEIMNKSKQRLNDPVMLTVLKSIEQNYATVSLQSVAKELNYNRYYLSNLIKKKTGQTFTELLNQQKLLQAQLLITSTKLPISQIIRQVGFSNKNYFYSKYQQKYGHLPTKTRNQN